MSEAELIRRLERLERDNRRLKRVAVVALALMVGGIGLGAAHATPAVPQKVVAHEFDVLDASGKVRIRLNTQKDGLAMVQVLDTEGVVRTQMIDGPVLGPAIQVGMHRAAPPPQGTPLRVGSSGVIIADMPHLGPEITLGLPGSPLGPGVGIGVFPTGQPSVVLIDSKGRERAGMSLSKSGAPNIHVSDAAGYRMELGSTSLVTPTTGETRQTSADSIVMFGNDKGHHVIWQAPQ